MSPRDLPEGSADERPIVRHSTDIEAMADESIAALVQDPDLYQRSNALVQVLPVTDDEHDSAPPWRRLAVGTPTIRELPREVLRARLSRLVSWIRLDARSKKWVSALPHPDAVAYVSVRGAWPGMRILESVIEAPTLRPDGSILQRPGYDRLTRTLYTPAEPFPDILENPTREDAKVAMERIAGLYCDFPFKDANHRATAIAAAITAVCRTAIPGGVPAFIFDANSPGAGKGLAASMASIIAYARNLCTTQFPGDNPDHLSKTMFALAREGAPIIAFDNLPFDMEFRGAALEDALTSAEVKNRVLGTSDTDTAPFRSIVFCTGNNVNVAGDMPRRCVFARLETNLESPERRTEYSNPERAGEGAMRRFCREHRAAIVADMLTVVRAHWLARRSDREIARDVGTMENFGDWVRVIAAAIQWAGGGNPLLTRMEPTKNAEAGAVATILERLPALDPSGAGLTTKSIVSTLYPEAVLKGQVTDNHDGFDALRDALEELTSRKPGFAPDATALGAQLRGRLGKVYGGRKLAQGTALHKTARWVVVDATTGRPITANG